MSRQRQPLMSEVSPHNTAMQYGRKAREKHLDHVSRLGNEPSVDALAAAIPKLHVSRHNGLLEHLINKESPSEGGVRKKKKKRSLSYHRASAACGNCRRRKIRCLASPGDPGKCHTCFRLKRDCHFLPVHEQPVVKSSSRTSEKTPDESMPVAKSSSKSLSKSSSKSLTCRPALKKQDIGVSTEHLFEHRSVARNSENSFDSIHMPSPHTNSVLPAWASYKEFDAQASAVFNGPNGAFMPVVLNPWPQNVPSIMTMPVPVSPGLHAHRDSPHGLWLPQNAQSGFDVSSPTAWGLSLQDFYHIHSSNNAGQESFTNWHNGNNNEWRRVGSSCQKVWPAIT